MAKLSKRELAAHRAAVQLLERGTLTLDETEQVYRDWHEGAGGDQTAASAFFTPIDMAADMRFEMNQRGSFVDLCAGTGRLAYFAGLQGTYPEFRAHYDRIVCVERNPAYVEIGRKLFPAAEWICGDALDPAVHRQIGQVDMAICNPPFGSTTRSDFTAPRYKGKRIDLAVMDVAATLAPNCWAIVPENVAPWDYRGDRRDSSHADAFTKATGLGLHRFASLDPKVYRDDWRGTAPNVEFVGFGQEYEDERAPLRTIHEAPALETAAECRAIIAAAKQPEQLALL